MTTYSEYQQTAIDVALAAIQQTLVTNDVMASSEQVKDYLTIQLAGEPDEWFGVMRLLGSMVKVQQGETGLHGLLGYNSTLIGICLWGCFHLKAILHIILLVAFTKNT
jgi:hypothetical protein